MVYHARIFVCRLGVPQGFGIRIRITSYIKLEEEKRKESVLIRMCHAIIMNERERQIHYNIIITYIHIHT